MATSVKTQRPSPATKSTQNIGRVVQVIGPVVDLEFPPEQLPDIMNAVNVPLDDGSILVLEVQGHLGNNWVRTISMGATDGLRRGAPAVDQGVGVVEMIVAQIPVGVGAQPHRVEPAQDRAQDRRGMDRPARPVGDRPGRGHIRAGASSETVAMRCHSPQATVLRVRGNLPSGCRWVTTGGNRRHSPCGPRSRTPSPIQNRQK